MEPDFTELDGSDPVAFILSANLARRHMTKGQRAMAAVITLSVQKMDIREAATTVGVSRGLTGNAAVVLDVDLADQVLAGTLPLNDAYETVQERKRQTANLVEQRERLRTLAPDPDNWKRADGTTYTQRHVSYVVRTWEAFRTLGSRPRWNEAYHSDEVRKGKPADDVDTVEPDPVPEGAFRTTAADPAEPSQATTSPNSAKYAATGFRSLSPRVEKAARRGGLRRHASPANPGNNRPLPGHHW